MGLQTHVNIGLVQHALNMVSARTRWDLVARVVQALSVVNFIWSFGVRSQYSTDLKVLCPVLGRKTKVVPYHLCKCTDYLEDQWDCSYDEYSPMQEQGYA